MKFISTKKNNEKVSFQEAVINGLSKNGGLYFPEYIPKLPASFFEDIESMHDFDIAFQVMKPYVRESLGDKILKQIIEETLSFPTPVKQISDSVFVLELFHGPTKAFKDVGARFMSRCLSHFYAEKKEEVTILVATSGDTGSAVANGFYNVPGIQVKILFPKDKVSPYQEFQMTSLGKNITALEVNGTFDDCQNLVKEAFNDVELRNKITLSSANSINIARLLPQMLYYFFAYKQLKKNGLDKELLVSVPSGNLGNLTAGLISKKMGLPIQKLIAALNANDTFLQYINSGDYQKKPSVRTFSNAMDVGNPSNFERIAHFYNHDLDEIKSNVSTFSITDDSTIEEIANCFQANHYLLDPHGAVGKLALEKERKENQVGLFLATAHPQKFSEVIQKAVPDYESVKVDLSKCTKIKMEKSYQALKNILLE